MEKQVHPLHLECGNTHELGPDPIRPGMVRVTKWIKPKQTIQCCIGQVDVVLWLESETKRIASAPGRRALVVCHKGFVSLYVN